MPLRPSPRAFNMKDMKKTYFFGQPLRDASYRKNLVLGWKA
jgi:hypothetical protein